MAMRGATVLETKKTAAGPEDRARTQTLLDQYQCGRIAFSGNPEASYERRLVFDHVVRPERSDSRQRFEAVAGRCETCCRSAGFRQTQPTIGPIPNRSITSRWSS